MKIAYIIFDGITWLDFIGIYDPISRLKSLNYIPDLTWDICSYTEKAKDNFGLEMLPTKIRQSLFAYNAIVVPGGIGTRKLHLTRILLHGKKPQIMLLIKFLFVQAA